MFKAVGAFSGFSVDNLEKAKKFYTETLDLEIASEEMGVHFSLPGGGSLFIYPKENHKPATFTVLNFVVENVDKAVDALSKKDVKFEMYEGFHQDEKGIARDPSGKNGPAIAWFKDPAGNILSVLQDK